jgi:serine/threonine protein kinase
MLSQTGNVNLIVWYHTNSTGSVQRVGVASGVAAPGLQGTLRDALDQGTLVRGGGRVMHTGLALGLAQDVAAALLHLHAEGASGRLRLNICMTCGQQRVSAVASDTQKHCPGAEDHFSVVLSDHLMPFVRQVTSIQLMSLLKVTRQLITCLLVKHAGVVHGDLKAANVLLTRGGEDVRGLWARNLGYCVTAKVADFGLALSLDPKDTHATMAARVSGCVSVCGTLLSSTCCCKPSIALCCPVTSNNYAYGYNRPCCIHTSSAAAAAYCTHEYPAACIHSSTATATELMS